jgi:tRNA threonylcarbamoyl adenosine modification protein (Sua5/YciO/YrdC/YwlC family)
MTSAVAPIVEVAPSMPADGVLRQAIQVLGSGGVVAFPTDTLYGIGCELGRPHAIDRIQKMREFDGTKRPLTFMLPDIGELPHYALVSESAYRIITRIFPGPYCAELLATARVPSPFLHEERRTIGVRIPDSALCERLLWGLGRPILTATAKSRAGGVLTTAAEIQKEYGAELDLIIDGGTLNGPPSTVVSLIDDWITVLREGRGPSSKILMG